MTKIKLIAIDVDNTLVNAKKEIVPQVKAAIQAAKKKGIKVVICTGRSLSGTQQYLTELGLANCDDQFIVSLNGAVVETTSGQVIFDRHLPYNDYLRLEQIARQLHLHFQAVDVERIYTADRDIGHYTVYNSRVVKMEISYRTKEEMANIPIYKVMYLDEPELLNKAMTSPLFQAVQDKVSLTKTEPFYYEGVAKGLDKAAGLDALCNYLNLDAANIMAIGDEANDISMIKYAGLGVAMGNATPAAKQAADQITADCEHAGVAQAIGQILA
ncbi:Cof-type HAD-IIB family hydrolase [Lactobacillus sp. ESL0679]|uniref:Cof-type HAD-IIB family hydrolase n=1 Tax=Lactobacillus sp. ESL0679 TaxID=2983209 RepID=UPI0023F8BEDF|nr:Cof-type HAD-IIB family hydrolase [Lactobacillus sp. ESL0679]MDF7683290.1 Cof-type HAD-IIB family hydrolase [Lactobacillus sp. ESL0679]